MARLLDALPALYRSLLPALDVEVPTESKATCASCAMTKEGCSGAVESIDGRSRLFRDDTKCCTYHPRLPNYLVGALLAYRSLALSEGRRRMRDKIAHRAGVTPQWVRAPAKYTLLYDHARGAFGRAKELVCPYFDGGGCSIWPYREAVCSTYFCKHVEGADGRAMWMSLKSALSLVEHTLSRHALFQLFPEHVLEEHDRPREGAPLGPHEIDDAPPDARGFATLWGEWAGREAELYQRCFELVSALSADDLARLVGADLTIALAVLEKKRRSVVDPRLPDKLGFNAEATIKWLPDGTVGLGAYSELEGLALPAEAYPLLVMFTGDETNAAVRARMRREKGADLDDDVLLALYRHRVLTARP